MCEICYVMSKVWNEVFLKLNVHLEIKYAESWFNPHCHILKLCIHTRDTLIKPSHQSDDFTPCLSNPTRHTSPRTFTCNFTFQNSGDLIFLHKSWPPACEQPDVELFLWAGRAKRGWHFAGVLRSNEHRGRILAYPANNCWSRTYIFCQ